MPMPTNPPCIAWGALPPPDTRATFPATGAPRRTMYLGSRLTSSRSEWAMAIPWSASATTSSTWLISFFMVQSSAVGRRARHASPLRVPRTSFLFPIARPLDGLLPLLPAGRPLLVAPFRLPGAVDLPVAPQLVQARPEADGQAGRVRGAECCGLADRGTHHGRAEDVRLQLHQEIILDHAAVDLERLDVDAGIGLHCLGHVPRLVADALQRRAHQVPPVDVAREPHDRAARVHVPVGREESGEGGDEVGASGVLHLVRH